jgi:hypothetical protein
VKWAAIVLLTIPALASACTCQLGLSVCNEVAAGTLVFSGTVESVTPHLLDRWNRDRRGSMDELGAVHERFSRDGSPANLAALKREIQRLLPDLPLDRQQQLDSATTHDDLVRLFGDVLDQGRLVKFRVKEVYATGKDPDDKDDKDAKNDDDDTTESKEISVWTPFGDCGVDFQTGETYLVYSTNDEETGVISATQCTRTKRLTDAGADLPYLAFYRDTPQAAGRLEGFTTYDPLYHTKEFPPQESDVPNQPAEGLWLELTSPAGPRFTQSDRQGRFLFDGLAAGDYQVKAWAPGFPEAMRQLAQSPQFRLEAKACGRPILVIPRSSR